MMSADLNTADARAALARLAAQLDLDARAAIDAGLQALKEEAASRTPEGEDDPRHPGHAKDAYEFAQPAPWRWEWGNELDHAGLLYHPSPAHDIDARNAPDLVFYWEKAGRMFVGPHVNHPGYGGNPDLMAMLDAAGDELAAALAAAVDRAAAAP